MTEKGPPPPAFSYNSEQGGPSQGQQGGVPPPPPPGYGQPAPAYGQQQAYGVPPPPPPSSYPVQGTTTVVMNQPELYGSISMFREHPVRTKCPACNAEVLTSTSFESGTLTWVACLVLAFIGLWLGCCLIPFCLDGCKDVVHSCPNCRHTIGRFNRM